MIIETRERMISAIEDASDKIWATGLGEAWYGDADQSSRAVSGKANGELFEQLLRAGECLRFAVRVLCLCVGVCVLLGYLRRRLCGL